MPNLRELRTAVQSALSAQAAAPERSVSDQLIAEKIVMSQLVNRWQREASKQNVPQDLASFFHETTAAAIQNIYVYEKEMSRKRLKLMPSGRARVTPSEQDVALPQQDNPSQKKTRFEAELVNCIFAKLDKTVSTSRNPAWVTFFIETHPQDITTLIHHVCREVSDRSYLDYPNAVDSKLSQWMHDEASEIQSPYFSPPKTARLFTTDSALVDPILSAIPTTPQFCLNSGGQFRVFDTTTLAGMQDANRDYRRLITTIESSGPTGIGYIMLNLPGDSSEVTPILDVILKAWHDKFPMPAYARIEEDVEEWDEDEDEDQKEKRKEDKRQQMCYFHERWLYHLDRFLDQCAWDALAEEIRQIPQLEIQLADLHDDLDALPAQPADLAEETKRFDEEYAALISRREELDVDRAVLDGNEDEDEANTEAKEAIDSELAEIAHQLDNIERNKAQRLATENTRITLSQQIRTLQEQLDAAKALRDRADLVTIKQLAVVLGEVGVPMAIANQANWSTLLNYVPDDPAHVISLDQLNLLTRQAVDDLAARNFRQLGKDEMGRMETHLKTRRELQSEMRSNAENSLRTDASANGSYQSLSESLVRDPIVRTEFIDVASSTGGERFCHVIIGAYLWAKEHPFSARETIPPLPDSIQEFLAENPASAAKAIRLFKQFKTNVLQLPPAQMIALNEYYGLSPQPALPPATSAPRLAATKFGFLSRKTNHVDGNSHAMEKSDSAASASASSQRYGGWG